MSVLPNLWLISLPSLPLYFFVGFARLWDLPPSLPRSETGQFSLLPSYSSLYNPKISFFPNFYNSPFSLPLHPLPPCLYSPLTVPKSNNPTLGWKIKLVFNHSREKRKGQSCVKIERSKERNRGGIFCCWSSKKRRVIFPLREKQICEMGVISTKLTFAYRSEI